MDSRLLYILCEVSVAADRGTTRSFIASIASWPFVQHHSHFDFLSSPHLPLFSLLLTYAYPYNF